MKGEKLGVLDLKKISTENWVNSLWKVDEFALEIEAICTGNWMNLYWEFDEFVVGNLRYNLRPHSNSFMAIMQLALLHVQHFL